MEESKPVPEKKNYGSKEKTPKELALLNSWQRSLLPWLVIMPTILILLFTDTALNAKLKGDLEYIRWITLARMEEKSLDRRYSQGGLLLVSRIFTKYLGFFTGMILAIVGAIFIIGKLQESSSDIEGSVGDQMKLKVVSSSPGVIFAILGTVLMLSTILQHAEISVKDQPLFLNPANVYINAGHSLESDSVAIPTPQKHQINLTDIKRLEEDDAH